MKEKREKAMAELEEFFNRSSSESDDEKDNEFIILDTRSKVDNIFPKAENRIKRHNQLASLKVKEKMKYNSVPARECKPKCKAKIKLEDYNISHVIGKGATAIVKLGTHISKKTNVVFKIYDKDTLKKANRMKVLQEEIRIMK